MPSLGETLRRTREQQGRSLSELAKETCITSRYLAAIEADNPTQVPGEFFYRNYVKQYAKALRLDPDECAREAYVILPRADLTAVEPAPSISEVTAAESRIIAVAAACCIVLGAIVWLGVGASHRVIETKRLPVDAVPMRSTAHEPQSLVPQTAPQTPDAQTKVTVKVEANEPAWVTVSSEGKTLFRGRLQPAESKDFSGVENARLWTGNAAALNVEWNGKTIGPLGSRGQVALVLFTPETYRILAPHGL